MISLRRLMLAGAAVLALLPTGALADWPVYHLDSSHTGNDTAEPAATTVTNRWNTAVNGDVYAEPLVVGNAVLVATEQNGVYALDATTGAVLWSDTALGAPVSQSSLPCGNINPVGITGTPVVDTVAQVMYVTATLAQPSIHYELYALHTTDGTIWWHRTIQPANFNPIYFGQRGALALANGRVYIPFGGRSGDCGTYAGTVVGVPANGQGSPVTFALTVGHMGGIWASGGLAVDGSGNVIAAVGNTSCGSGCFDYGESVLKLSPSMGLLDYWAPTNYASLNAGDTDIGSVGPALLPNNLVFQVGKAGVGYLLNEGNLGHISNAPFSAQACPGLTSDAAFGGTAWAAPYIYVPCRTKLVALNVNTSAPSFSVAWQGPAVSFAGPPVLAGGVVWTIDPAGRLYGLDPTTGTQRYSIAIAPADHFATPSAGLGRLFVPTGNTVRAFKLAPAPEATFNPPSLTFGNRPVGNTSSAQSATLTNSGDANLTVNTIAASGDFAQTNNCGTLPVTLAPGGSCTITVTFTPTGSGTRSGAVTVTDTAADSPQQLALTGYSFAFNGAYTLDGYGGLHADGGSPPLTDSAYWPNWRIARSGALLPGGGGGYVMDGYGGLHPFGNAPTATQAAYFPGNPVARDVVFLPTATAANPQGYTLEGYGGVHPFGGAPAARGFSYWPGWDVARRIVLLSDGSGGYVMDAYGGLHPFAVGANPMPPVMTSAYWPNWTIARDVALAPGSTAGNVAGVTLDGYGGVHPFGSSGAVTGAAYWPNWDIARAVRYAQDSTAAAPRGWVLDGWGGCHAFGGAPDLPAGGYWPNWDIATQLILG